MAKSLKINSGFIQEIDNFMPIIKTLPLLATKNPLVIFDVDSVLIMPDQDNDFRHPYRMQLWQALKSRLSSQEIEILHSKIMSAIKWQLIELDIMKVFAYLKAQNIPTIALTAMATGKFGIIKKMEDFRIDGLNSVGLSFLPLTPLKGQIIAAELNNANIAIISEIHKGIPMLKDGIILTAGMDKGKVLEYMLHKYNYHPKTIMFIDNNLKNLESLKQLCLKLNIDFCGFHYVITSFMPLPNINEDLEELRFKILEQEGSWLSYQQLKNRQVLKYSCNFPEIDNIYK